MNKQLVGTLLAGGIAYLVGQTAVNLSKQTGLIASGIGIAAGAFGAWVALAALK